jgi:hypothetical protein
VEGVNNLFADLVHMVNRNHYNAEMHEADNHLRQMLDAMRVLNIPNNGNIIPIFLRALDAMVISHQHFVQNLPDCLEAAMEALRNYPPLAAHWADMEPHLRNHIVTARNARTGEMGVQG